MIARALTVTKKAKNGFNFMVSRDTITVWGLMKLKIPILIKQERIVEKKGAFCLPGHDSISNY